MRFFTLYISLVLFCKGDHFPDLCPEGHLFQADCEEEYKLKLSGLVTFKIIKSHLILIVSKTCLSQVYNLAVNDFQLINNVSPCTLPSIVFEFTKDRR